MSGARTLQVREAVGDPARDIARQEAAVQVKLAQVPERAQHCRVGSQARSDLRLE
jgi:hypothetical protein